MVYAVRIHKTGGPEVLTWEEVSLAKPGPGEALIRQTAIGLNFIDTYYRCGIYPVPLPAALGNEAAGIIEALGPDVTDLEVGDRVSYGNAPIGAYAEARLIPAGRLVKIPDGVSDQQAAAVTLKGLTAWYLLRQTYRVKPGDTILLHAAAGGVGLLACQWARHLGVKVIGTCSTDKIALAKTHGCAHVIDYTKEDFVQRVIEITDGNKVPVVYDSVGRDTFLRSLDCLAPLGLMVSFGQSSGLVEPFSINILTGKGSLYVTRPTLAHYVPTTEKLRAAAKELFGVVAAGAVKIEIGQTFPLKGAAEAHRALEGRKTTGSTVLLV